VAAPATPAPTCPASAGEAANLTVAYRFDSAPDDIALIDGTLYVSLLNTGMVVAYRGSTGPTVVARGIQDPEGIAPGPAGTIYVVEQSLNRLDRVSLDGSGRVTPVYTFANPRHQLGVDSIRAEGNGKLLVPDSPNGRLLELDPATGATRTIAGGLGRPVDAIPFNGGVAVADENLGLVLVSADGARLSRAPGVGGADDLAPAPHGGLFITGINDGVLYRYGEGRATVLTRGFKDPQGLVVDTDGSLLVADSARNAILRHPAACAG